MSAGEMLLAGLSLAVGCAVAARPACAATAVRVMTFNVRYGTAPDGANRWERRRALAVELVRTFSPDILGTQETLDFQRDALLEGVPGYDALGVGREDGAQQGEMTALFYRCDRFARLDGGHFWLSLTPGRPGSVSWDTSLTRMATWVKLRDRRDPGAPPILALNTHFDHRGEQARLESARLIRRRLAQLGGGCRIIVTGDFNCGEGSPPYAALFGPADGVPSPLRDAYRLAHPRRSADEGTYHGFDAAAVRGGRIDWIGVAPGWKVVEARIDRTARDGRLPSDHYPVTAVLEWSTP